MTSLRVWGRGLECQLGDGLGPFLATARTVPITDVVSYAAQDQWSVFVKSDGTVWGCGADPSYQLGPQPDNGGVDWNYWLVTQIQPSITSAVQVVTGQSTTYVRLADGTVWSWGEGSLGQLGNGAWLDSPSPVQVAGLSGVVAIAAGGNFCLALRDDGTLWAWGQNNSGQCGQGVTTPLAYNAPVQVQGLEGVEIVEIAAGSSHAYLRDDAGDVWVWGNNASGQLGMGDTTLRSTPVQHPTLANIARVFRSTGANSWFLADDGTLYACGNSFNDIMLQGSTGNRTAPVVVPAGPVQELSVGGSHVLVIVRPDGTVWSTGSNMYGQLGDGTFVQPTTLVQMAGVTGAAAVVTSFGHALVQLADGTIKAVGSTYDGQCGCYDPYALAPQTPALAEADSIAAGYLVAAAVVGGQVYVWGEADWYLHGRGESTPEFGANTDDGTWQATPKAVSGLTGVASVAVGLEHALALKADGTVWAWGRNNRAQLGLGGDASAHKSTPVQVTGLANITKIAAGWYHSYALDSAGDLWAWGRNNRGQLGTGDTTQTATPTKVLSNVVDMAAGGEHGIAVKGDGTVWTWGSNFEGELGKGSTGGTNTTPAQISGVTGTAVYAGYYASWVLQSGGALATGYNGAGQLGLGDTDDRTSFTAVPLANVASVGTGTDAMTTFYVLADGTVWACGATSNGELGERSFDVTTTPVQVPDVSGAVVVATNRGYVLALQSSEPPPTPETPRPKGMVEIAFPSRLVDPPVWIDVTPYCREIRVTRGRSRELTRFDPGTATIVLDNQDRRFDPSYEGSPYWPNVKPMRRLRVSIEYDGTTYYLFSGFVETWPQSWPGMLDATVEVSAVDAFKVLNLKKLRTAYPQELSGARIDKVLSDANVVFTEDVQWILDISLLDESTVLGPVADRHLDAGQIQVPETTLEDDGALEHIQAVTDAELGEFWIDGSGRPIFKDRHSRYKPEALTTQAIFGGDAANDELPYADIEMEFGDAHLWNDVAVQRVGDNTTPQRASDTPSEWEYGGRTLTRSGQLYVSDDDALVTAQLLLELYKQPKPRINRLTVKPFGDSRLWPVVLGLDLGSRVEVRKRPPGGGPMLQQQVHIERIEHTFFLPGNRWETTWGLSPAYVEGIWILDDPVFSVLEQTTKLAP